MTAEAPLEFGHTDEELATASTVYGPGLFDGKVVVVSGGGSGIGKATAWLAARLGARVIVCGRTPEKLEAVASAIRTRGLACEATPVNIRDRESVDALFRTLAERHGPIDALVNSAGGQFPQAMLDFSVKGWKAVIETNLDGTFHMMQAAGRAWREQGRGGSVVNIVVSRQGLYNLAHTCAARAGVIALSESVAVEWAPLGIRVNCIAPGTIVSAGWAVYAEETRRRYPNTNPMRRAGTAWEIAEACVYLIAPSGAYITGETLYITGGGHLWGEIWATEKPEHYRQATRIVDPPSSGED